MSEERFVDHYEVLQVSRNADAETIERVFRLLAKRYHPDNTSTGDSDRFVALSEAHRVLSDPHERARYDAHYESGKSSQWSLFFEAPLGGVDEDQRIQQWILSVLHQTRRRSSSDPGVGIYELENYLEVAEGQLEYHLWYLKEKGWLMRLRCLGHHCRRHRLDHRERSPVPQGPATPGQCPECAFSWSRTISHRRGPRIIFSPTAVIAPEGIGGLNGPQFPSPSSAV